MPCTNKILAVLAAFVLTGAFCAFGNDAINKSIKAEISCAFPPQARTTGTVGANTSNARSQWGVVDVKFRTDDVKNAAKRFIDNPELEVKLAIYPQRNNEYPVLFTGKVTYYTIEQNGRDHYMRMLLPAPIFRRYAYNMDISKVTFVALVALRDGSKVLGAAVTSNKSLNTRDINNFFRKMPRNIIRCENTLTGRQGTTWSIIEVNKFEYEKNK